MTYSAPDDYVLFSCEMFINTIITAVGFYYYLKSKNDFNKAATVPIFAYYFSRMTGLVVSGALYILAYTYTQEKISERYKNYGLCFYQTLGATVPASSVIIVASLSLATYQMIYYHIRQRIYRLVYLVYLLPLLNLGLNVLFTFYAPIWIMINTEIILAIFIVAASMLLYCATSWKEQYVQNSHHSMLIHQLWLFITAWASYIIINTTMTILNNENGTYRYYSGFDSGFDIAFSVLLSVLFLVPKRVSYEYLFNIIDRIDVGEDSPQDECDQ